MDIFPAYTHVAPLTGPVENLDVDAYIKGLKAPNAVGAIAEGITAGISANQTVRENEAKIEHTQAAARQAEAEAALAPLRIQTEQLNAQTAAIRARTEAEIMPQKAAIDLMTAQTASKRASYEAQTAQLDQQQKQLNIDQKIGANKVITAVQGGDVVSAVALAEENKAALIGGIFDKDNPLAAGYQQTVESLPQAAREAVAAGQAPPEIIQRADRIYGAYQRQADVETAIKTNKHLPPLPGVSQAPVAVPQQQQQQQPLATPQMRQQAAQFDPAQQGPGQAPAGSAGIQPQVPAQQLPPPPTAFTPGPVTQQAAGPSQAGAQAASAALPPLKEAAPASVNSFTFRNERIKTGAEQNFREAVAAYPGDPRDIPEATLATMRKDAYERSVSAADGTKLASPEQESFTGLMNAASNYNQFSTRMERAFNDIDKWIAVNKESPQFEPGDTWSSWRERVKTKLGYGAKYNEVLKITSELEAVAGATSLITNREFGGTGTSINSEAERELMKRLFIYPGSGLVNMRSGLNLLKAKAREATDIAEITDTLLDSGENYSTAIRKAFNHRRLNPSYTYDPNVTTPVDQFTGTGKPEAILMEKTDRQSARDYLTALFTGGSNGGGGQEGRIPSAAATPTDGYSVLSKSKAPDGTLDPLKVVNTVQNVDPRQIPNRLPQANEALVHSLIGVESDGNPNAKNPKSTASGLMQLIDGTGKPLWKSMGFDKTLGEYNPFHPEANVAMGTKYLNQQLDRFNGDVRLAVAAYKRGPGEIEKIYKSLLDSTGETPTWEKVQIFLPEEAKKDAVSYVNKVLGDDRLDKAPKMPPGMTYADAVSTLPEGPAQQHATVGLTPRAKEDFASTITATKISQVQGTPFGDWAAEIMSLVSPQLAEAQPPNEQGGGTTTTTSSAPTATTGLRGGELPTQDQYVQVDPSKNFAAEALVMGVARIATFGGDITAAAHLTSWMTGEPYENAYQRLRGIEDALYEKYKGYYLGGEALGAVLPGAFSLAKTTASTVLGTIGQGAKIGAATGGVQGFLETHPSPESTTGEAIAERTIGGVTGAAIGTVVGGTVGGAIGVGQSLLKSKAVTTPVAAGIAKATGEEIPKAPRMNKAQAEVSDRYSDLTTPEMEGELAAELSKKNPNRVLGSTVPGVGNIEQAVKAQATVPGVSSGLQRKATKYFDVERNTGVHGALKENIPEYAIADAAGTSPGRDLTASLERRLAGRNERVGQTLGAQTSTRQLPAVSEDVHRSLANITVAKEAQFETERAAAAAPLYERAKEELPDLVRQPKANVVFQVGPYTGDKRQLLNKGKDRITVSDGQLYRELKTTTERVPGIADPKFIAMVKRDPVMSQAIDSAQREVGGGTLPANSLEVLKQAKRNLAFEAGQPNGHAAGVAFARLRDAMGDPAMGGSTALREADRVYFEGSETIRGFATPLVQKIQRFAQLGQEADVAQLPKRILAMDKATLTQFMDHFTPAEQLTIKDSVLSHLHDQFVSQGEKTAGKLQSFPDLTKPQLTGRLETIFGEAPTKQILSDLATEQKLQTTLSGLHGAEDPGKYLLDQPIGRLKTLLSNLEPNELSDAKASVGEHVMNTLRSQKEPAANQGISFPDFTSDQGREKLQLILGEDAGNALVDRFKEDVQTSGMMQGIRRIGSPTTPTAAENQRQKAFIATRAIHGVLKLVFKNMAGIPEAQLDMAAIIRSFPAGRKAAQEVADIIVNNPEMRIEFLKKDIAKRLRAEKQAKLIKPMHDAIDAIVASTAGPATRGAAQGTVAAREDDDKLYNPMYLESRAAKRQQMEDR